MYLNFSLFYRLRFLCAVIALVLALLYLAEVEKIALIGFAILSCIVAIICNKIRKGTMLAVCDLCKTKGTMKAEYGAGFSNARLVIDCPRCGRVVNKGGDRVYPQKE